MSILKYLKDYILWHYTLAISDFFTIWKDIVWFTYNYFSIPLLLRTLFSPWKRLGEKRKGYFDFVYIIMNLITRIYGAIFRIITILIGLIVVLFVIALGPIFLLLWIILPVVVIALLSKGISLIRVVN